MEAMRDNSNVKSQVKQDAIIFIHGGAWRDPNNTFKDFEKLIKNINNELSSLSSLNNKIELYSLDYRLSPTVKHPCHLIDVINAINYIIKNINSNLKNLTLVGHSVGSTLAIQVLDYKKLLNYYNENIDELDISFIKNLVLLDGIYDIPKLLDEYPSYLSFINEAFEEKNFNTATQLSISNKDEKNVQIGMYFKFLKKIIIVQSENDELLSLNQTNFFVKWLNSIGIYKFEKILDDFGKHNDVYESDKLKDLIILNFYK
ncbi:hypothetical protein PACTADRAFT_74724 [Pachysolen tannophilus NRRL Y-2460]|uniref:Kynurenine formamidase n=1 Tax=Pachysolen tannophilus NRRL Y-2460 TaxID=669874 RepID=A0A1E4TZS1_PACTA|nr:hypothetical protein PACTADRAFT_74724 [Pachysolen tannophilus NRRL Y-2460]